MKRFGFSDEVHVNSTLKFQLRLNVSADLATSLREDASGTATHVNAALGEILQRHHATLKCQYDAFADYVSEAERLGTQSYPLYEWTRETLENAEKKAKYLRSFTVYVNGEQIYEQHVADVLENELTALVGESGIERVSKFDTNPANNPQPPKR